jgi:hypothetical protein
MRVNLRLIMAAAATICAGAGALNLAQAADDTADVFVGVSPNQWSFEITPYAWLPGLKGDVTVRGHEVSVDQDFSDIFKAVKFSSAVLGLARYNDWILWSQVDYMSLSTSQLDNPPARGELATRMTFYTVAGGYTFEGWSAGQKFDVLLGVQGFNAENTLTFYNIASFENSRNVVDATLIVRPSFRLTQHLLFNPTMSYGAGDSKDFYQLQPQFQYQFNKTWEARIGYRKMHYTIDSVRANRYDMNLAGPLIGFGATF